MFLEMCIMRNMKYLCEKREGTFREPDQPMCSLDKVAEMDDL
jgi:hypothetical protein